MANVITRLAQLLYPARKKLSQVLNGKNNMTYSTNTSAPTDIYSYSFQSIDGKEISLNSFRGKKMLLVNTASECGYTPQYTPLQTLHEKYGDRLVVIGFPANNFGAQEPGNEQEIQNFCERNYGVTFLLSSKIDVVGENQHPLFRWLTKKELNGWNDKDPNWNFCKYLVNENGALINFFSYKMDPLDPLIIAAIEK